jgi:hypothetical protein
VTSSQYFALSAGWTVAVSLAVATPALGQGTTAPRTTGGLFGATRSDVGDRNRMNVTIALSEAFDTELPADLRQGLPQDSRQSGGLSTMLTGTVAYAHNRRRAQLAGNVETAFRYYDRLHLVDAVGHSAGLGANIRLPGTATFRLDQSAAYSPSYLYALFPPTAVPSLGDAIPVAPDYRVVEAESYRYKSELAFAVGSARGTRLSVSGAYDRTEFSKWPTSRPRLETYGGRAKLNRAVRRNLGLSVEYEYRTGQFGVVQSGSTTEEHRLALGADYTRPFSGGRRLNLRGNVAPSMMQIPPDASSELTGSLYRVQGEGSVEYAFRRTWRISSSVRRVSEYHAVLAEPVFSDTGNLALRGQLTRRIDVEATAAYTSGASAVNPERRLESYMGNWRLRFAINRSLAAYGEYLYYYYDLRRFQQRDLGLPGVFDQQGVRIGVMLWASAF